MQHQDLIGTEILFAAADAVWQAEIVRRFGNDAVALYLDRPEARGEPGSLLRDAWEVRARARSIRHAALHLDWDDDEAA